MEHHAEFVTNCEASACPDASLAKQGGDGVALFEEFDRQDCGQAPENIEIIPFNNVSPAAAVMTRRKFAGMRSAVVTSRVIVGNPAGIHATIAPRLIKLCYVNASVRLGQRPYEPERRNFIDLYQKPFSN